MRKVSMREVKFFEGSELAYELDEAEFYDLTGCTRMLFRFEKYGVEVEEICGEQPGSVACRVKVSRHAPEPGIVCRVSAVTLPISIEQFGRGWYPILAKILELTA
ncbi:MAG: hypothetical protein AB7G12_12560 [Thermoanaerobaculia bacterium]